MEHEIILDLLPLYADGCCSEASRRAVEEHLAQCNACKEALQAMAAPLPEEQHISPKPVQVTQWKASVLQAVLLFVCFGIITLGVALEAATPAGLLNGYWAFVLVVPSTGALLSLSNWFFVRLYKSRKRFSWTCCGVNALFSLLCCVWTLYHYGWFPVLFRDWSASGSLLMLYAWGIGVTGLFVVLSKVLSSRYARLLGKE